MASYEDDVGSIPTGGFGVISLVVKQLAPDEQSRIRFPYGPYDAAITVHTGQVRSSMPTLSSGSLRVC